MLKFWVLSELYQQMFFLGGAVYPELLYIDLFTLSKACDPNEKDLTHIILYPSSEIP